MSQSALEAAKNGNPQAIAALMNRQLNPKGITVKASLKEHCLSVVLESENVPNEEASTVFISKGLAALNSPMIERVKIYGQQTGEGIPAWNREIELTGKLEITETVRHVEAETVEEAVQCPKCGSKQIVANKKGFGVGKAAAGVVLLGPLGLAGGMIGSNEIALSCMKCGNRWEPKKLAASSNGNAPVRRVTMAKVYTLNDKESSSVVVWTTVTFLFVGVIGFLIPVIGWIIALGCLYGAGYFIYQHVTGKGEALTRLEGDCPHCMKQVVTHNSPKHEFSCIHCKQKVFVKDKEFSTIQRP